MCPGIFGEAGKSRSEHKVKKITCNIPEALYGLDNVRTFQSSK